MFNILFGIFWIFGCAGLFRFVSEIWGTDLWHCETEIHLVYIFLKWIFFSVRNWEHTKHTDPILETYTPSKATPQTPRTAFPQRTSSSPVVVIPRKKVIENTPPKKKKKKRRSPKEYVSLDFFCSYYGYGCS